MNGEVQRRSHVRIRKAATYYQRLGVDFANINRKSSPVLGLFNFQSNSIPLKPLYCQSTPFLPPRQNLPYPRHTEHTDLLPSMRWPLNPSIALLFLSILTSTEAFMVAWYTRVGCRYDKTTTVMQRPEQGCQKF